MKSEDIQALLIATKLIIGWALFFINRKEKIDWFWAPLLSTLTLLMILLWKLPLLFSIIGSMFIYHYYFYRNLKMIYHLYFSFFPIIILNIFSKVILFFIIPLFVNQSEIAIVSHPIYEIVSVIMTIPFFHFIKKVFSIQSFSFLGLYSRKISHFLITTDLILITYTLTIPFINARDDSLIWIRRLIVIVYFLIFMYLASFLSNYTKKQGRRQIEAEQRAHIVLLESCNQQTEYLYQRMRCFKHDYENFMISLAGSIETGNFETMELVRHEIKILLEKTQAEMSDLDLERYLTIESAPLKTLIALKLTEAKQKGFKISTHIIGPLKSDEVESLDMLVFISTIIDYAIARAERCLSPYLAIVFNKIDANTFQFLCSSSLDQESEKNSSTILEIIDRTHYIIDDYMKKYTNYTYTNAIEDKHFTQKVTIVYEENQVRGS